jgi:hypothetical protein
VQSGLPIFGEKLGLNVEYRARMSQVGFAPLLMQFELAMFGNAQLYC